MLFFWFYPFLTEKSPDAPRCLAIMFVQKLQNVLFDIFTQNNENFQLKCH